MRNTTKEEFAEKLAKAKRVVARKGWFVGVGVQGESAYQHLA